MKKKHIGFQHRDFAKKSAPRYIFCIKTDGQEGQMDQALGTDSTCLRKHKLIANSNYGKRPSQNTENWFSIDSLQIEICHWSKPKKSVFLFSSRHSMKLMKPAGEKASGIPPTPFRKTPRSRRSGTKKIRKTYPLVIQQLKNGLCK